MFQENLKENYAYVKCKLETATANNGKVASQSHKPGTILNKNASITIVVNKVQEKPATPPAQDTHTEQPANQQTTSGN